MYISNLSNQCGALNVFLFSHGMNLELYKYFLPN